MDTNNDILSFQVKDINNIFLNIANDLLTLLTLRLSFTTVNGSCGPRRSRKSSWEMLIT